MPSVDGNWDNYPEKCPWVDKIKRKNKPKKIVNRRLQQDIGESKNYEDDIYRKYCPICKKEMEFVTIIGFLYPDWHCFTCEYFEDYESGDYEE